MTRPLATGWRHRRPAPGPPPPDGTYVVHGYEAERAVALNDLTTPEALIYAQARLKRMGVDNELARAGARQGDPVRIGKLEFDYDEE